MKEGLERERKLGGTWKLEARNENAAKRNRLVETVGDGRIKGSEETEIKQPSPVWGMGGGGHGKAVTLGIMRVLRDHASKEVLADLRGRATVVRGKRALARRRAGGTGAGGSMARVSGQRPMVAGMIGPEMHGETDRPLARCLGSHDEDAFPWSRPPLRSVGDDAPSLERTLGCL